MGRTTAAEHAGVCGHADRMLCDDLDAGKHIGLAAAAQVISWGASRCITAREPRRALEVRVNVGADGVRPGSFVVLYRPMQPDVAVQDTGRSAT